MQYGNAEEIFAEVGLEWDTAPSKAKRFFAALEGRET